MRTDETAVLIADSGLAGLLLAGDLATAGLPVAVLDSQADDAGPGQLTLSPRTLEQLDARGLADSLVSAGLPVHQLPLPGERSLDLSGLPSRYPFALIAEDREAERLLAARARSAGATFFSGIQVTAVRQTSDQVIVEAADSRKTPCTFSGSYLVRASQGGQDRVYVVADGPGANASVQDAVNLSWKLIAVLRDGADLRLLASYAAERAQARRYAQRQAAWLGRLGPAGLRAVLRIGPAAGYAARALSGLTFSYPAGAGRHWMTGRRVPDAWLADGTGRRLYEALREQRPIVLAGPGLIDELRPLLDLWTGRVLAAPAETQARLMLVRPDCYVGWASDSGAPARQYAGMRAALTRHCGSAGRTTIQPTR